MLSSSSSSFNNVMTTVGAVLKEDALGFLRSIRDDSLLLVLKGTDENDACEIEPTLMTSSYVGGGGRSGSGSDGSVVEHIPVLLVVHIFVLFVEAAVTTCDVDSWP